MKSIRSGTSHCTLIAASIVLVAVAAGATEVSTGLQLGYGRRLSTQRDRAEGLVLLGFRADLLFGRDSWDDFGLGPHVGVSSPDPFSEVLGDVGLSILLPVGEAWPVILSAGPWVGSRDGRAGILGRVLWGVHPFNYHSAYVTTFGLFGEVRAALEGPRDVDLSIGVHVDGYALLYPFVILYQSILHGAP